MSKILVVDDEKSIRTTLKEFLLKEGFKADTASDVQEAVIMLDNIYDVIVTDIIMPNASGLELVERIRGISESIQIIIMTGEPTVDTAIEALKHGANEYLVKPVSRQDFLKSVRRAAQVKSLTDQKKELEIQNLLYQKNLEELVESRTKALRNTMKSIIVLLTAVVEVRDPYTAGHQRRVGNLSAAIAKRLNLDNSTVELLRIIGYIHDIGKIFIPSEILSKPGQLSRLEFDMITKHSEIGFEMLTKTNLPELIEETIFQHHERCDGSGYPRGLKGDQILLEAKILAVADVVEAMTSHRPYRPALGLKAALYEIKSKAGHSFDNDAVNACISLFETDGYVIDDQIYTVSFPPDNFVNDNESNGVLINTNFDSIQ